MLPLPQSGRRETLEAVAAVWNADNERLGVATRWQVQEQPAKPGRWQWTLAPIDGPWPGEAEAA